MNENTIIAHYRVIRPLGAGGMGEVYLAEDTRLDRQVAIKVLPERLRQDAERLARFRREAKAAARLKHPNIATIHALEEIDDLLLIVMEYVDGVTLKDVIPDGGMELGGAVDDGDAGNIGSMNRHPTGIFDVFIPLADALAHAHAEGRIHRDLKPGNIMIAADGTPKILDFGLARIIDPDPVRAAYEASDEESKPEIGPDDPTRTMKAEEHKAVEEGLRSLTRGGRLMGTPQYMSPEQAERMETDARTDLFSFGVMLYEAVTGQRPFEGATLESIIGRITEKDPEPVTVLKPVTPYSLGVIIRKCLVKDRERRMQSALELHTDLLAVRQEVQAGAVLVDARTIPPPPAPEPMPEPKAIPFWWQPAALGFAVGMLILGLIAAWVLKPAPEKVLRKFQIPVERFGNSVTISPDGKKIAYVDRDKLWIRELDKLVPREIPDSQDADRLFWSQGSDHVGYFSQGTLRKVSSLGGASTTLARINSGGGAVWKDDGKIIHAGGGLRMISAQGGEPELIRALDAERDETWFHGPSLLPDGETLIFSLRRSDVSWDLVVLESDTLRVIVKGDAGEFNLWPRYSDSGFLLYHKYPASRITEGSVWALPFDADRRLITGDPILVTDNGVQQSLSLDGTLVYYNPIESGTNIVWVDRAGTVIDTVGTTDDVRPSNHTISPDGLYLALEEGSIGLENIYIYNLINKTRRRFTFTPEFDVNKPAWHPSGGALAYTMDDTTAGQQVIILQSMDGTGKGDMQITSQLSLNNPHISSNGQWLVYNEYNNIQSDLWMIPLFGDRVPRPLTNTPSSEISPAISPDGRYIAYVSDMSGTWEVYLSSFPSGEGRWQISKNGGGNPRWGGNELFYVAGATLMAVTIDTRGTPRIGTPQALFSEDEASVYLQSTQFGGPFDRWYDVSSDSRRFVLNSLGGSTNITVVENWYEEFKED